MGIEKRLRDILLYAIGMLGHSECTSLDFFLRVSKYLRSIGYYGDSPFMMCNYGSSEYSQALSRIGSLFGNVYIVNDDMEIQDIQSEDNNIKTIETNYNNDPVNVPKGIIAGHHYKPFLNINDQNENKS